jgi:tRNA (cytidine56-2'-O)-methyltransferase
LIAVLRLGHRISRDKRITTHVALVARVFGADQIFISTEDKKLEEVIRSVVERFGGDFSVQTGVNYHKLMKQWAGFVVHLTMYGEELEHVVGKIPCDRDLLVVVGAEKVPSNVYQYADFNVAVGNQPHSEVAALALFLDRYTKGTWQTKQFNGRLEILPSDGRKKVLAKQIHDKQS